MWETAQHFPSEPIFVPNPSGTAEDTGVLLTVVFDMSRRKSYVLVLDARDLSELAVVYLNTVVPFSAHGSYDESL